MYSMIIIIDNAINDTDNVSIIVIVIIIIIIYVSYSIQYVVCSIWYMVYSM